MIDKECVAMSTDGIMRSYAIVKGGNDPEKQLIITFREGIIRKGWLISNIDEDA